jgi:hypothetical protein
VAVTEILSHDFENKVPDNVVSVIFKFDIVAILVSTIKLSQSDIVQMFQTLSIA